ncbi:response regulator [Sphingomicrobium aestuariivivum]|uniref:response regulator n=1 Tax=Sphingomicrobium aestuariivivum TaxID=1582356 RepID=UPI001FD6C3B9|nr:response regulator [Sphingomicrobium aestuariivivum]MCJ8191557.1 response regulator [Sphingomicrobium aestuariivivum]
MTGGEHQDAADWKRVGVAIVAFLAMLALIGSIWLVSTASSMRDAAMERERSAYDVTLLTRTLDASMSRSEAALGRFVLDEETMSGNLYYNNWRLARQQLNELYRLTRDRPEQRQRVQVLVGLFNEREEELSAAARAAAAKQREGGISLYYAAGRSPTGQEMRSALQDIADAEREALSSSIGRTQFFAARANRLNDYLIWLGALSGLIAIFLGAMAFEVLRQYAATRREAERETNRAFALEEAVAERTAELSAANEALRAEAEEREAAEARLRQAQKMEAVGQLTGGIAHDFNNMLAVVVGGLDLARRHIDGPRRDLMGHLTNAMEGATRAAALTRRLLSFARAEPLLPERVEAGQMIGSMRELLDRTLGEQINITYDIGEGTWPVFVDAHQFENALLNLALNARDAMAGEGKLLISAHNVTLEAGEVGDIRGGDYLRVAVSDTGKGMSDEVRERAFEPFFTTKEVGKGTGLGLSQIFGFAHQSGGDIGIDTEVGEGTTVSIYLPRSSAEAQAPAPTSRIITGNESDDMVCANARILVVEDDPRVRTATVGALEDLGYDPASCGSGAEALDLFEPGKFDLVISDVIMPEMTGTELVRHLKAQEPGLAVLFVTGYVGEDESDELADHELLRKPFTVGALSQAVADALRQATPPAAVAG